MPEHDRGSRDDNRGNSHDGTGWDTDGGATPQATTRPLTVSRPELLVNGTDQEFRQFVHRMLAFSARIEAVRSGFGSMVGLTGIQYTTLISIAHLEKSVGVGVKTIADHLGLSGSFVTLVTGQLVKLELAEKTINPKDRRRVRLRVTRKGLQLLSELASVQREVNDVLFHPIDREQFQQLNALLEKLVRSGNEAAGLIDYLVSSSSQCSDEEEGG